MERTAAGRTEMSPLTSRLRPVLLLTLMVIMSACSPGGSSGSAEEVTFMIADGPEELKTFQAIADAYNESQGAYEAVIVAVSEDEDLITRLSTDIAGGNAPDVFFSNYRYLDGFVTKGLVHPIGEQLAASTAVTAEEFYPASMDAYVFNGEQYCMPFNASNLVVYYNRSLFKAAGLDEPANDWTWKDMVADAKALTSGDVDTAEATFGMGVEPQFIRVMPFVWSAGGDVVDDHTDPTKLTMTSLPAQDALARFLALDARDQVAPNEALTETEGLESLFANGSLAMYMDSRKVVPEFRTITDFEWDVAPLPMIEEPFTILHSDGYCITEGSKNPEGAWSFIEFAVGTQGQEISAETGRAVPSMISVAESDVFLDPKVSPSRSKVFLSQLAHVRGVPIMEEWVEIEDVTNGILEEGFFDGEDAPEVGDFMNRQTKPLLAQE